MPIPWCDTCRYLGIYRTCAKKFQANCDHVKYNFYRSFNCIMAKIGLSASWCYDVMVQWLHSKCLSILLYGTKACNPTNKVVKSLDYVMFLLKNNLMQQPRRHYRLQTCLWFRQNIWHYYYTPREIPQCPH